MNRRYTREKYLEEIFESVEKLQNVTVIYRLWTLNNRELDNSLEVKR